MKGHPEIVTRVWDWFKRTFHRDPTKMSKKDAVAMMHRRMDFLRQADKTSTKQYKSISRFVTPQGKPKGIWSRKLGMYSQMKQLHLRTQTSKSGATYSRTYTSWSQQEKDTISRNINLPPSQLHALLQSKHQSSHTIPAVSAMKARLKSR